MGTGARCGLGLNPGPLFPSCDIWTSRCTSLCPQFHMHSAERVEPINIREELTTVLAEDLAVIPVAISTLVISGLWLTW